MKKYIIALIMLFLITGCYNIKDKDLDKLSEHILSEKTKYRNTALRGYKLYLPIGMTLTGDSHNNNVIFSGGDKYYLYVDLISYYNKSSNMYKINKESGAYFKKTIEFDDKIGYIIITEENDGKYFIEILYNYAKIEVRTSDVREALAKSLIVLKSIKYNDKVIESLIGNNIISYDEEEFELKGPKTNHNAFLEYDEQYGTYVDTENELPDEDIIVVEE